MSGTAALAAARRRRAGGANTSPQPMSKPTSPQQKVSLNPVQILQQHDKQIFVLTNEFNEIKKKNVPVTNEDIEFYKDKYNTLLSEMTEMKTNFVKMQTFCMETNMKVEAMNKRLDSNLEEND